MNVGEKLAQDITYRNLSLQIELYQAKIEHEKVQDGRGLVLVAGRPTDVPLLIDEHLSAVLFEAKRVDACLQVEGVDLKIL